MKTANSQIDLYVWEWGHVSKWICGMAFSVRVGCFWGSEYISSNSNEKVENCCQSHRFACVGMETCGQVNTGCSISTEKKY